MVPRKKHSPGVYPQISQKVIRPSIAGVVLWPLFPSNIEAMECLNSLCFDDRTDPRHPYNYLVGNQEGLNGRYSYLSVPN